MESYIDRIIGGVIERGFSLIDEIIKNAELSSSEKNSVFENLMKEASHGRYDGWTDWKLNFLETCSRISDKPDLRNKLENHMALFGKKEDIDSWGGSYFAEKVNQIRYNMILQNDGEKKAKEFIEQNLQFSSFRKMSIERATQENKIIGAINMKPLCPRHKRLKREGRLQAAKYWIPKYNGKNIVNCT